MRPTLTLIGATKRSRSLADLEHKPWAAEDGRTGLAAFPLQDPGEDVVETGTRRRARHSGLAVSPPELAQLLARTGIRRRAHRTVPRRMPGSRCRRAASRRADARRAAARARRRSQSPSRSRAWRTGWRAADQRSSFAPPLTAATPRWRSSRRCSNRRGPGTRSGAAEEERESAERERLAALRERDDARKGWRDAHQGWAEVARERDQPRRSATGR